LWRFAYDGKTLEEQQTWSTEEEAEKDCPQTLKGRTA
jgi:hypothetical protein